MKKIGLITLALATALAIAPAAKADTFNVYFNGAAIDTNPGISGEGTLTGSVIGGHPTEWDITGGTLDVTIGGFSYTTTVVPIANPLAPQPFPGDFPNSSYDNIFIPGTAPYLDTNGLLFTLAGAGNPLNGDLLTVFFSTVLPYNNVNVWDVAFGTNQYLISNAAGGDPLSLSQTPEPSSMLLFGTGLLCMAGFFFRKALPNMN